MKFLIESYLSKYDDKYDLLEDCNGYVYHATPKENIDSILKNGLKNFWFGYDALECIDLVVFNRGVEVSDSLIVIEIPTDYLDIDKCDFTVDSGDGYSDRWFGTGFYSGTLDVNGFDVYSEKDDEWGTLNKDYGSTRSD